MFKSWQEATTLSKVTGNDDAARIILNLVRQLEPQLFEYVHCIHQFQDWCSDGLEWYSESGSKDSILEVWVDVREIRIEFIPDIKGKKKITRWDFLESPDPEFEVFCLALESMRKAEPRE